MGSIHTGFVKWRSYRILLVFAIQSILIDPYIRCTNAQLAKNPIVPVQQISSVYTDDQVMGTHQ